MKKKLLFFLFTTLTFQVFCQDDEVLRSKRGYPILPKAGDMALGFDAIPLVNLALNTSKIGSNTGVGAEHPGYVTGLNQVIVGKYFLKDNLALRVRFGLNTFKDTEKNYGENPLTPSDPDPEIILLNKSSASESSHFIGLGLERRRGYNRLYGIYGGELLVGYHSDKVTNKYEIEFNNMAQDSGYIVPGAFRLLSSKNSGSFTFGIRGFVGVEYFVAPKISVGAEFGWSVGFSTAARGYNEFEIWGIPPGETSTELRSYTEKIEGDTSASEFGVLVDTGISSLLGSSAAVTVHFHF